MNIRPQHDAQFDPQSPKEAVAVAQDEAIAPSAPIPTLELSETEIPTSELVEEPIAPTQPFIFSQPAAFVPELNLALAPVAMDIPDVSPERESAPDASSPDMEGQLRFVRIEDVIPSPTQPRKHFVQEELEALARSIAESGLLQPLVVRRHPEGPVRFEIVAGERRWRAAKLAGLAQVPVIVRD